MHLVRKSAIVAKTPSEVNILEITTCPARIEHLAMFLVLFKLV